MQHPGERLVSVERRARGECRQHLAEVRDRVLESKQCPGCGQNRKSPEREGGGAKAAIEQEPDDQNEWRQLQRRGDPDGGTECRTSPQDADHPDRDQQQHQQVRLPLHHVDPQRIEGQRGHQHPHDRPPGWPQPAHHDHDGGSQGGLLESDPERRRRRVGKQSERCDEKREARRVDVRGAEGRVWKRMMQKG